MSASDASAAYDIGRHLTIKVQAFNLLDRRTVTSFTPGGNSATLYSAIGSDGNPDGGIYTFQAGRQVEVTVIGRF